MAGLFFNFNFWKIDQKEEIQSKIAKGKVDGPVWMVFNSSNGFERLYTFHVHKESKLLFLLEIKTTTKLTLLYGWTSINSPIQEEIIEDKEWFNISFTDVLV